MTSAVFCSFRPPHKNEESQELLLPAASLPHMHIIDRLCVNDDNSQCRPAFSDRAQRWSSAGGRTAQNSRPPPIATRHLSSSPLSTAAACGLLRSQRLWENAARTQTAHACNAIQDGQVAAWRTRISALAAAAGLEGAGRCLKAAVNMSTIDGLLQTLPSSSTPTTANSIRAAASAACKHRAPPHEGRTADGRRAPACGVGSFGGRRGPSYELPSLRIRRTARPS